MKETYKVNQGTNAAPTDIIGQVVGDWGPWQFRSVMIIFLCKIPAAWFMAVLIFTGPEPRLGEYVCQSPSYQKVVNESHVIQLNHPIPSYDGVEYTQRWCGLFTNASDRKNLPETPKITPNDGISVDNLSVNSTDTVDCNSFERAQDVRSIITDFDLGCKKAILVSLTQTFHLIGVLFGGVIATFMLNR